MGLKVQVCVVGMGPAGSMVAGMLAERGIDVCAVEKRKEIGIPVQCGEGVSEDLIKMSGIVRKGDFIVRQVKGSKILTPSRFEIVFNRKGYLIRRDVFDRLLFEKAIKNGARAYINERVTDVHVRKDNIRVFTNKRVIDTEYLIAADGPHSKVRQVLGIDIPAIFALEYKLYNKKFKEDYLLFYNKKEFYPGYAWVFDRGEELAVGIGRKGRMKPLLEIFVRELGLMNYKIKDVIGGYIPTPIHPPKLVEKRVLFIGDAGGFVHPIVKGGIIGAVFSAKKAAVVMQKAIEDGPQALYIFYNMVKEHASRDKLHYLLLHLLPYMSNEGLDYFGRILKGKDFKSFPLLEGIKTFLKERRLKILKDVPTGILFQRLFKKSERLAW